MLAKNSCRQERILSGEEGEETSTFLIVSIRKVVVVRMEFDVPMRMSSLRKLQAEKRAALQCQVVMVCWGLLVIQEGIQERKRMEGEGEAEPARSRSSKVPAFRRRD